MNKKTVICIVTCVILAAALSVGLILSSRSNKAEYISIAEYNFDNSQKKYQGLETSSYSGKAEFRYSETDGIDGSGCIVIDVPSEKEDARFTYTYDKAIEKTYYRMSAWVKTVDVGLDSSAVGANISVLNTFEHSVDYKGDNEWTYIEYYGKTANNQTSFTVCLRLGFYSGINTGTVYFDDFQLEQLDKLPEGASYTSMESTLGGSDSSAKSNSQHENTMLTATIMLIVLLLYLCVAYRYAQKQEKDFYLEEGRSIKIAVINLIIIAFVIRLVMSVTMPQCDIDVNLFQYWANTIADKGIMDFYSHAESISLDYPPLFMYHLYFMGVIGKAAGITQTAAYDMLLKLPSILADCVIAYLIYKIANKRMNKNWILFVMAIWLFNPMVLLDSACWGQVDSILALAILLAAYYIEKEKYTYSAIALAFAITLKPQGIFFVPILGYALLNQLIKEKDIPLTKRLLRFAYSIVAFFATAMIIILPFGIKMEGNIFSWILNVYVNTAGGYSYATVNSFNFPYLLGLNWVKDSTEVFGLSYFALGMLLIVVICLLTGALYLFGKKHKVNVYLLSAMCIYAVTQFAPRMHERYFYPAIILLLVAVIYSNNKLMLALYGLLSVSNFYTVLEVMTGLSIGSKLIDTDYATAAYYYWPPLNTERAAMAVTNVFCAVALIAMACVLVFSNNKTFKMKIWEEHGDEDEKEE